jgi:hypothetical protein
MLPVAVHVAAVLASGVEDAEDDSFGVALAAPLALADADAPAHPLTVTTSAAPTSTLVSRWVVPPRSTTFAGYSLPIGLTTGETRCRRRGLRHQRQPSRGEVDGDPTGRVDEARIPDRAADALPGLAQGGGG